MTDHHGPAGTELPRLLDAPPGPEPGDREAAPAVAVVAPATETPFPAQEDQAPWQEPALLDLPPGTAGGPLERPWAPGAIPSRRAPLPALGWIAGGFVALLLGGLALAVAGFLQDQFARSPAWGWIASGILAAALAAVLRGVWLEARAVRRLRRVDALRALLARDEAEVAAARALALAWLAGLAQLPEREAARAAVLAAADLPALRAALHRHLAAPLRRATRRLGQRAAVEGGALVAISPSPALDGVLAGLRGLALIRQVAVLHGLRPGGSVTLALLRRLAWTAAATAGLDLLGRGVAEGALAQAPVLRQVAAALPGAGLAALRLRRLAAVTARACSPLVER